MVGTVALAPAVYLSIVQCTIAWCIKTNGKLVLLTSQARFWTFPKIPAKQFEHQITKTFQDSEIFQHWIQIVLLNTKYWIQNRFFFTTIQIKLIWFLEQGTCVLSRHSQKFKLDGLQRKKKTKLAPQSWKPTFLFSEIYFQAIIFGEKNFEPPYILSH